MKRPDDFGPVIARWTHEAATPLGPTTASYEIRDRALVYACDDVLEADGGETVPWDAIREGATASMSGVGGRGAPEMPGWAPTRLEWLTLSRVGAERPFMRRLPVGPDRDALVTAVRARLGPRWIGDDLPLPEAQARLGIASSEWSNLKVAGLVVGVLVGLVALLIVVVLLTTPIISIPLCAVVGAWLVRAGLRRHAHGAEAAGVPVVGVAHAKRGLVHLEGRAAGTGATPAAVTGRPALRWDVAVFLRYRDSEQADAWRQVASRYGGAVDVVDIEDASGRLPVWLDGADLLLQQRTWHSGTDPLPAAGVALLDELGFPWHGTQTIRVVEQCLESGGPLYVLGTIEERGRLPVDARPDLVERVTRSIRTGSWRRPLVAALPHPLRTIAAAMIAYLDLLGRFGSARERTDLPSATAPPVLAADQQLVWKGTDGRPFIVSDRPEASALSAYRRRALIIGGIGAALLCFAAYELVAGIAGR